MSVSIDCEHFNEIVSVSIDCELFHDIVSVLIDCERDCECFNRL